MTALILTTLPAFLTFAIASLQAPHREPCKGCH
jgi:hypothetical protein